MMQWKSEFVKHRLAKQERQRKKRQAWLQSHPEYDNASYQRTLRAKPRKKKKLIKNNA